jgi:hypothetical protein
VSAVMKFRVLTPRSWLSNQIYNSLENAVGYGGRGDSTGKTCPRLERSRPLAVTGERLQED